MFLRHCWPIALSLAVVGACHWESGLQAVNGASAVESAVTLDQLCSGQTQIVDLTYALNEQNAYWPAPNYEPFRLKTIATLEQNGVLSKALSCPEHLGTHLDAPNHFEKNQPSVDQIQPENLFAAGVVIDIAMQVSADADYQATVKDLTGNSSTAGFLMDPSCCSTLVGASSGRTLCGIRTRTSWVSCISRVTRQMPLAGWSKSGR